jgi:hypothetical protein
LTQQANKYAGFSFLKNFYVQRTKCTNKLPVWQKNLNEKSFPLSDKVKSAAIKWDHLPAIVSKQIFGISIFENVWVHRKKYKTNNQSCSKTPALNFF